MFSPDDRMAHILARLDGVPSAVILVWVSEGDIKVINIVPFNNSTFRIETEDYNRIIDEFYNKIITPVIDKKYDVEVTAGDYTLQELIPQSYRSLEQWVHCPGAPNAPFSHQLDLERWFNFLCQLIRNDETLGVDQLEQWLREEVKWPEEIIEETLLKYEEEIDLLDYYANRSR